jgi:hypothetical protein
MKNFAIKINDFLVSLGLFLVVLFTGLALAGGAGWVGIAGGLIGILVWAIVSGWWCLLSGMYDELKKINKNA